MGTYQPMSEESQVIKVFPPGRNKTGSSTYGLGATAVWFIREGIQG